MGGVDGGVGSDLYIVFFVGDCSGLIVCSGFEWFVVIGIGMLLLMFD